MIKRLLCMLLSVCILLSYAPTAVAVDASEPDLNAGDYLYFGTFDSQELVWQVLKTDGKKALLFCATPFMAGEFDASIHEYTFTGPTYQIKYGSCGWRNSDVRAYLNSAADKVVYNTEQFDYTGFSYGIGGVFSDNNNPPSYASKPGFLSEENFEEAEVALLEPVTRRTLAPYTDPEHENGNSTPQLSTYGDDGEYAAGLIDAGYAYETLTDRMFLLSTAEFYEHIYSTYRNDVAYDYAENMLDFDGGSYWLRDPEIYYYNMFLTYLHVGLNVMGITKNGYGLSYLNNQGAGDQIKYIRPACYINLDYVTVVSGDGSMQLPLRMEIDDDVMNRPEYVQSSVYRQHPTDLSITVYRNRKAPNEQKSDFVLTEGIKVRANDRTYKTDANGQLTIPYPRTSVTISYDGYVTRKISPSKLEAFPEVYLQQESEYPVINAVWAGKTDVLNKTYALDPISSGTHNIKVEVDWGESAYKNLYLQQEGTIFALTESTSRLTWTDHFDVSEKIYVVAENEDGLVTKLPLKIEVQTYDLAALEGYAISVGNGFNITLGEESGEFLNGTEVGFDLYSPIIFKLEKEDGRVYILFGAQLNLSQSSDDKGSPIKIKQMVLSLKDLKGKLSNSISSAADKYKAMQDFRKSNDKFFGKGQGTLSIDAKFQLMGFMEGYETRGGEVVFVDGGYIVAAEGSADYTVPVSIGVVPAFGGFTIASGVNATFNTAVSPETKRIVPDGELEWDSSISLYGGVGMKGIVSVSAGIKGSLEWDLHYDQGLLYYYQLRGTVKPFVKGEAGPFTVSKDFKSFVDEPLYTYPESGDYSLTELQQANVLADASEYTLREVNESVWKKPARGADTAVLMENASVGADPQLLSLEGGKMMLFFVDQNPAVADANGQQLYCCVYENGQWSEPVLWGDDGTADAYASVGGDLVTWTNFGALTQESTLESAAKDTSVAVKETDGEIQILSEKGKLSYAPIVVGDYVIWQGNTDNDWLGTKNNTIYCASRNNGVWGKPKALYSGLGTIISMTADVINDKLSVAWSMDTDGDLTTADDIEVFCNGQQLTLNETADSGVFYRNGVLYWCCGNELMADGVSVLASQDVRLSDRFEIVEKNGLKAMIFTAGGDYTSTIYISWCENGVWQQPTALTDGTESICDFSAEVNEEGRLVIVYNAQSVDPEAEEPFGAARMYLITVESGCDLVLSDIYTDCSAYVKDCDQEFLLTISNRGARTANGVYVEIYDSNERLVTERYLQIALAPGQTAQVSCVVPMYKATQDQVFTFRLRPTDVQEANEADNALQKVLHWDDLSLENFSWGYREDGSAVFYAGVVNRGYSDHTGVVVNLRKDAQDGPIVDSCTIETLASFGQKGVSFAVAQAQVDALYYITVEADDDRNSNNYCMAAIGSTLTSPEEEHEHSYVATVIEPTCTDSGYTEYVCSECGERYAEDYVEPLGHLWEGTVIKEPTQDEWGVICYCCVRCGAEGYEDIPPLGSGSGDDGGDGACDGGEHCPCREFNDLNPSMWYHKGIDFVLNHGFMNGTGGGKFEPDGSMTRAMLVTVLWRFANQPIEGENQFVDVPDGKWYTRAVAWAAENGVVTGVGGGKFDPDGKITREQMATILFRYSNKLGLDTSDRDAMWYFPDEDTISKYAFDAVSWAVAIGLINGNKIGGETYLEPKGNATRAQVATILMRYIENVF